MSLKVSHLNKRFGKKQILKDVSFEVRPGEVLGFLGPNGAGKTTVLKTALGFLHADSGTVEICGYRLDQAYEKALSCVGGVIENPEMYKHLTGWQNLKLYANMHPNVTKQRIDEMARMMRLENRIHDKVKKYSLGMKQRLGLAQALLHDPAVLLLDEPTNGLDPAGIHELRNTLKTVAHQWKKAVLVSSHLLSEMELLCDRIIIIQEGTILGEMTQENLRRRGQTQGYIFAVDQGLKAQQQMSQYFEKAELRDETHLWLPVSRADIPRVLKYLLAHEINVYEVESEKNALESIFLEVTGGGQSIA